MTDSVQGDMPVDELRQQGRRVLDWVAGYIERVDELPVLAEVPPGEVASAIPTSPPAHGEPMDAIVDDLDRIVLPGITHWQHPRFLAYFAITGSGPGILGELAAAGLNVNGMLWRTSPAVTEVEEVVLDWLRQMLGLPEGLAGTIVDTASTATFTALAVARDRRFPDLRIRGPLAYGSQRPCIYTSEQANSSVEKAAIALGFGRDGVRTIPVDDAFRMRVDALAEAVEEDLTEGWAPVAVVATVGTTSTTSIDPVARIAEVCREHGIWLHVDGAYGATAAIVPELRHVVDGVERADSLVVNPHKWLATPIDLSALYVRDLDALKRAFSLVPDYLATTEVDVENLMDRGVQLGRRFRGLKLWFVIRYFGVEGLATRIREHVRLAALVASAIDDDPRFERVAPTPLSVVCFRAVVAGADGGASDRLNQELMDAVNATGRVLLSHTVLHGRFTLRIAIGNLRTTEDDVHEVVELLRREVERILA